MAALVLGSVAILRNPLVPDSRLSARAEAAQTYAITPRRQALLNTIRYAEGTWKQGSREGYHTLYGGGRFASLARHPEIVVVKRYTSAAAGAYQFLPTTWKEASQRLQLNSFDPSNQDQAALYLVDRRGVLDEIDQAGLTPKAMAVLAKEWRRLVGNIGTQLEGTAAQVRSEVARIAARPPQGEGSRPTDHESG